MLSVGNLLCGLLPATGSCLVNLISPCLFPPPLQCAVMPLSLCTKTRQTLTKPKLSLVTLSDGEADRHSSLAKHRDVCRGQLSLCAPNVAVLKVV